MVKAKLGVFIGLTLLYAGSASALPSYNPSGPQTSVSVATVTGGGWTLCYQALYGDKGTPISTAVANCTGSLMMLAGGATGSNTLDVLAWADKTDVMFDTGTGNIPHIANGTGWYFNNNWSWGFAPQGAAISRNSCDTNSLSDPTRLCWHTASGTMDWGWRDGANTGLNSSTAFTKYIFTADASAAVSEPEPLALLSIGMIAMIASRRRLGKNFPFKF